jgi:Na+-translocating ferredoxin:NAD+ oxidoreductase subunit B
MNSEKIYTQLQEHLDQQAVGFPATKSGVEIRILKELFTPEQANLALHLNYQPQSVLEIFNQINNKDVSCEQIQITLEEMENNGTIRSVTKNDTKYYCTIPLLVGIAELHSYKATPQFWADFSEYLNGEFGMACAKTKVSQFRTIPVGKSVDEKLHVATYDQIKELIINTDGPIGVGKCMCREGAKHRGDSCKVTSREETCMGFGDWARHFIKHGFAREISRDEALEITHQNEKDGLVLQPSNYQKIDFVCACCGCCCGILTKLKSVPKPAAHWAHNYYVALETKQCVGCKICVKKCQMNAIKIDEMHGHAIVNSDCCIGCGNCVTSCPAKALKMRKRERETVPPQDFTDLYKILAEKL